MGKNILVVDDSVFIFEELMHMLKDTPYQIVGHAKTGEAALELYENLHPDIVTMDIILPGIDGFEAAKDILDNHAEAKIIMVSSLAYDDTMEESKKIGACGFIFKPIEKDTLLEALDKCSAL